MNDKEPSLVAAVFLVTPSEPVTAPGFLSRAVHRFWLEAVGQRDAALEPALHDQPDYRPFTCSTLVGGERLGRNSQQFTPDSPAWLRITALTPAVSRQLCDLVANPPAEIELDGITFQVQQATTDPSVHRWAGKTAYEALAAPYLLQQQATPFSLTLRFASPTTFRMRRDVDHKKRTWPIPMPEWVFGFLHRRWNAFSSIKLPAELDFLKNESIVLSRYNLKTHAVPLRSRIPQMGCVGRARYVLIDQDVYATNMLHLLATFSFYAGVGYQTTVGFGQTRLLSPNGG
jgi:CRISPR-associated endoribonuclease Cas6